jgi:para-aminobenzoate synthetase/4-amino-4-deoxychorismate lyase
MLERAVIRDRYCGSWLDFGRPREVMVAWTTDQVLPRLAEIERVVEARGLHAVGYIAYEAAPAFDSALAVGPADPELPLLCFGLCEAPVVHDAAPLEIGVGCEVGPWQPSQTTSDYGRSIARIREHIAAGDTYQVNYTIRLRASFRGNPRSLFASLIRSQPDSFAAYLDLGSRLVCSASPELLLRLDGDVVESRPMKGTAPRGFDAASDHEQIQRLRSSAKDRAENAMIVDMVRNDLGRVADAGTVRVTRSFDVERHPTVLQMTSTVTARTSAPLIEVLAPVFPYASITGAPKPRTMSIIRDLEQAPRGVYTGAIGFLAPGRRARFSVAIRTAVVDRTAGRVEYGVGGGIVWDSVADDEYRECLLKARILTEGYPSFHLLETLRWDPSCGYRLLERHLARLEEAADYFARPLDLEHARSCLEESIQEFGDATQRVRLLVAEDGGVEVEAAPLDPPRTDRLRLGLAHEPVRSTDPFLRFKTTHRETYERALRDRPDCDDVLLLNEHGEVTESTVANLVLRSGGELVTPPISCGLLPGTFRAELLERGKIRERVLRAEDVATAESVFLINSVRGWIEADWNPSSPHSDHSLEPARDRARAADRGRSGAPS